MHQHCSGVLFGWHIQSVKMHLCRINIVRSAANSTTPYILYASTVCCAVLIRQKAHKQSHMHQQRQLSYYGSLLLRRALCWQTQHLCTKLELNLVQSAVPIWLINNAGLLESAMWKMHFYRLHQHCEVWCISCNPFMHQHSDALFGPRPHTATDVFSRTSPSSSCLFVFAKYSIFGKNGTLET